MSTRLQALLQAGVAPAELRKLLEAEGLVSERAGGVEDSIDFTGDGVPDVLVVTVRSAPGPGGDAPAAVLVYVRDAGQYLLAHAEEQLASQRDGGQWIRIYSTADANGDGVNDLIYAFWECGAHTCNLQVRAYEYDRSNKRFADLLDHPISAPFGQLEVRDLEGDGRMELLLDGGQVASVGAGPQRNYRETYRWDGAHYVLARWVPTSPRETWYAIHYVHDGDNATEYGRYAAAVEAYQQVLSSSPGRLWMEATAGRSELPDLRAYVRYRLVLAYLLQGDGGSATATAQFFAGAAPGDTEPAVFELGHQFWATYTTTQDVKRACAAVVKYATDHSDSYKILNSFGYANRQYMPRDLCPVA